MSVVARLAIFVLFAMSLLPPTANAATVHPIFVRADSRAAGAWAGYTANVQVRPDSFGMYTWPGGYLSDGTFVQNGMLMPGSTYTRPGEALIFAWATGAQGDPLPLAWVSIPSVVLYSWYTFELTKSGSTWTFRYKDPAGAWHTQGSFTRSATLATFSIVAEYWAEAPSAFGTQAIQHAWVRSGTTWGATSMAYGPPADQCGHETITSTTPSNAVFKAVEGPCIPYVVLW